MRLWLWQTEHRRPTWDEYFLMMAQVVATRATCDRGPFQKFREHRGTGTVIVSPDKKHIAIGYNGSPPGQPHCDDAGHLMNLNHCNRVIHSEENAILNATFSLTGATLYVTTFPCYHCAKRICAVNIQKVNYINDYHNDPEVHRLFLAAGIEVVQLKIDVDLPASSK